MWKKKQWLYNRYEAGLSVRAPNPSCDLIKATHWKIVSSFISKGSAIPLWTMIQAIEKYLFKFYICYPFKQLIMEIF